MQIRDEGYIIKSIKYGESSAIISIVSKHHGKIVGFVKNAFSKKKANIFELGNLIEFEAKARLEDNMPIIQAELLKPNTIFFINSPQKINILSRLANLLNYNLQEMQDIERLYYYLDSFFEFIDQDNWLVYYAFFEFYFLDFLGIGIDLSICADTQSTNNLTYVSPKSAQAVCKTSGDPYKDKLFLYPHFIINCNFNPNNKELEDCLKMTDYFINKNK